MNDVKFGRTAHNALLLLSKVCKDANSVENMSARKLKRRPAIQADSTFFISFIETERLVNPSEFSLEVVILLI